MLLLSFFALGLHGGCRKECSLCLPAGVRDSQGGQLTPGADNLAVTGDSLSRVDTHVTWKSMTMSVSLLGHLRGSWGWEQCDYPTVPGMEGPEDVLTLPRGVHQPLE